MEDFPLLILFFIIYLIAGSSGKKKNKQRSHAHDRRGPARSQAQGEQMDARAKAQDRMTQAGFQTAFDAAHEELAHPARMHLHEVTNEQMLRAAEGEDPCHAGGIQDAMNSDLDRRPEDDLWQDAGRQDVLRGVIMSEILMRPHERRAMQRSRQRTNGY